jgi:uncharacterized membrane protein YraQ (UPF0718 family)
MIYQTLWPLLFGLLLSGIIQTKKNSTKLSGLKDHKPLTLVNAAAYGTASSSCSYAAASLAKTLIFEGADFITSMAFMIAATNLVIEIGFLIAVFLGYKFLIAEVLGTGVMILIMALTGRLFFPKDVLSFMPKPKHDHGHNLELSNDRSTKGQILTSLRYFLADLNMIKREIFLGYAISAALMTFVPTTFWTHLFFNSHGIISQVLDAILGPFIGMISFVCSEGNIPIAASLWSNHIAFSGVISFIYADLLIVPIIIMYVKFYGKRIALRLIAWLWFSMSIAGLLVSFGFQSVNALPKPTNRIAILEHFNYGATFYLDIIFVVILIAAFILNSKKRELKGYAYDPICHMQVEISPHAIHYNDKESIYWFCSDHCKDKFIKQLN